ncbi:hypothetical protein B0H11DRAFT_1904126 [Mycena galericulata]|nr:hypothetical protein B0H11DRAFT_1904126 [Mycena galericulata]
MHACTTRKAQRALGRRQRKAAYKGPHAAQMVWEEVGVTITTAGAGIELGLRDREAKLYAPVYNGLAAGLPFGGKSVNGLLMGPLPPSLSSSPPPTAPSSLRRSNRAHPSHFMGQGGLIYWTPQRRPSAVHHAELALETRYPEKSSPDIIGYIERLGEVRVVGIHKHGNGVAIDDHRAFSNSSSVGRIPDLVAGATPSIFGKKSQVGRVLQGVVSRARAGGGGAGGKGIFSMMQADLSSKWEVWDERHLGKKLKEKQRKSALVSSEGKKVLKYRLNGLRTGEKFSPGKSSGEYSEQKIRSEKISTGMKQYLYWVTNEGEHKTTSRGPECQSKGNREIGLAESKITGRESGGCASIHV